MLDRHAEGPLGQASAMADYVVVDMVAEAASGSKTVQQAIDRAAERASATTGVMPTADACGAAPGSLGRARAGCRACRPAQRPGLIRADYCIGRRPVLRPFHRGKSCYRFLNNRNVLGMLFMAPAVILLVVF
jgi:hypothetical protein